MHLFKFFQKADSKYIAMLRSLIESGFFYYSHGYDLTNSLQRIALNQTNVLFVPFSGNINRM
jgi:basic membrane lipoprotein Med (substrate-binding protein (PBP1-ABC) superfamily)